MASNNNNQAPTGNTGKPTGKRLYDSRRWRFESKSFLRLPDHCLCVYCKSIGILQPATLVDHIKPHNNNYNLFWDHKNWQGLCSTCHSGLKRKIDHGKVLPACDTSGNPIDPNHPWNK